MALVRAADPQTSSVSSTSGYCRYHVFLSFRGQDTRKTFTDHLYTALVNAGFRTFRDYDEVERGEGIKPELQKAIKHSRTSVIVFSKDYASSRWCLDELVMILERKRKTSDDHVVLPVFYDVYPSHVKKQTGSLAKAFARHQKTQPLPKVKAWREALAEVSDLAGMVLQNQAHGYESKFIKKIVKVIGDKLSRTPLSVAPNLVGMHSRVERINFWLQRRSTDVGILVIYGMSGIGKTTIAKTLYNSNFRIFEGSSFLENIKEVSDQPNGLVQIQTQLLSDILNGKKMKISNVSEGLIKIEDAISSKRVLLVLDDADHLDQLDAVLQVKDRFYPGSKIIITTRRARLLKAHQITEVYAVGTLTQKESLELFSWHAFGQDHPVEDYIEYSEKLVDHCGGLPLALKVLGSSLLGESVSLWKSALEKLKVIPNGEIINKLRVSYDSLQDDHDQKLFLHIACFFIGMDKDYIAKILDGCDFYTIVGIQNLIDRCLVIIDGWDKVRMHDLIRGMGREIVRLESKEPWKRSRVWHHKDSFKILTEKNGTETIEGLVLDMHMCPTINSNEKVLETNAFSRMQELKLLHLSHVKLRGCYAKFCSGLRWLCWLEFPLDSIPVDFPVGSIIVLEMQYSGLRQVFKGTKYLPSLKTLDLSHSHSLTETIEFSYCPNLEKLVLVDCTSLIYVHGSIGNLERLIYLNMKDCKKIRLLPQNICMLKSLETFIISGCSNLKELSIEMLRNMDSLKVLETDGIPISELWLESSLSILCSLPCSLVELSLWGCNLSDDAFPMDFSNISSLQRLNLGNNPICSLPNCIKGLARLDKLSFSMCTSLKWLLGLPKVKNLDIVDCISLEKMTFQSRHLETAISFNHSSLVEWQHKFKLQAIFGLCNLLESMAPILQKDDPIPVQGLCECGIFSTFLCGNRVPGQFSHKSRGSSISFTVPLLDNHRIRGLIVFVVYVHPGYDSPIVHHAHMPLIRVKNKSKGLRGMYCPSHYGIPGEGEDMIWLSHWNLYDQLEGGDEVVVSVIMKSGLLVKELGIRLLMVQQEENHNMMSISTDSSYEELFDLGSDLIWFPHEALSFNMILGDSDEEGKAEEVFSRFVCLPDEEEEQQDDITVATTTGSNNSGGLCGWKVLAACFCCPVGMKM
ncbi:unnamed protein product [Prunus brigantina]